MWAAESAAALKEGGVFAAFAVVAAVLLFGMAGMRPSATSVRGLKLPVAYKKLDLDLPYCSLDWQV